jgi:hypothetical protein
MSMVFFGARRSSGGNDDAISSVFFGKDGAGIAFSSGGCSIGASTDLSVADFRGRVDCAATGALNVIEVGFESTVGCSCSFVCTPRSGAFGVSLSGNEILSIGFAASIFGELDARFVSLGSSKVEGGADFIVAAGGSLGKSTPGRSSESLTGGGAVFLAAGFLFGAIGSARSSGGAGSGALFTPVFGGGGRSS